MKSIKNEGTAHCPHKCEPFDVEYWSLIRADQDPDLKIAAMGGELNLVRCPECGEFFHHDGDLIYFDAPSEVLVFVFSEKDRQREPELAKRMRDDYETIKHVLLKQMNMDYPPVSVFGLEELKLLLQADEKASYESEAVAAASAAQGFAVTRLKPSYAREHHFPFYVPTPTKNHSANEYAVASAKVLKSGLNSTLLRNFADRMSEDGAQPPRVL